MTAIEILLFGFSIFFLILAVSFLSIVLLRMIQSSKPSRKHKTSPNPDLSNRLAEAGAEIKEELLGELLAFGSEKKIETYLDGVAALHGIEIARFSAFYDAAGISQRYMDMLLQSRSWKKRAFAAEKLGKIGSAKSVPVLLSVVRNVKDEDEDVRGAALRALGRIRDESSIPFLIQALGFPETWLPPRIGEILVNIGKACILPLIKDLKNIESENRRVWAAEILGWLDAKEAVLPLVESLSDISPEVRSKAAGSLGRLKDNRALGRLLELLVAEPVPFVRVRVAQALGSIGDPSVVDHLINILKDPEWWVRVRTVEALEYLGDKAVPALLIALEDDDPEVQRRSAMALERIGYIDKVLEEYGKEKFRPDLRKILFRAAKAGIIESIRNKMSSADLPLKKNIVRILGEAEVKESTDLLLDALREAADWTLRARIIQSLGKIRAKKAVPDLVECLRDIEYWVRKSAVEALALIEAKEAADRIAVLLQDPSPLARQAALNALSKLKILDYKDQMQTLLSDPSLDVKSTAVQVMGELKISIPPEICLKFLNESSDKLRIEIIQFLASVGDITYSREIMELLPLSSEQLRTEIINYIAQIRPKQFIGLMALFNRNDLSNEILCSLIQIAGIVGDQPAVDFIMEFIDHLDSALRKSALLALRKIKPKGYESVFENALMDPSDEIRVVALAVVSSHFDVKTLLKAKHMMEDPSTDIRIALALAYGASGSPIFKEKLSIMLQDPVFAVRTAALVSLSCVNSGVSARMLSKESFQENIEEIRKISKDGRFEEMILAIREKARANKRIEVEMLLAEDERKFTQELLETLKGSLDSDLRARVMDMLKITANEEVFISILSILKKDPSKRVRIKAMETLVNMDRDDEVIGALSFALTDPASEVRIAAAGLLGRYHHSEALENLLNALETTDRDFREAITTALSRILIRQPEKITGLIQQIPATKTRKLGMAWLLGKTQQPGAIRFLNELLKDADPDVRASAIGALAKFKHKTLSEHLEKMIYDPNERVRAAAVNAISVIGNQKAFDIIKNALEDVDEFVRKRAGVGLAKIDLEKSIYEMEKRKERYPEIDKCLTGIKGVAGKNLPPSAWDDPVVRNVVTELCPEQEMVSDLKTSSQEERRLYAFRILAKAYRYKPSLLNSFVRNDPSSILRDEAKTLLVES